MTQPQAATLTPVITAGAIVAGGATLDGSASMAAQTALAAGFYSGQAFLAATSIRDILAVWSQLNLRDVRSSWPALRTALASLIRDRFGQSALLGQAYYQQARQAAGIPGAVRVVTPPMPSDDLITATLDSMGPWNLLGKIKQGQQVATANENTSVQVAGAAQRLITNGARQAVLQSVAADAKAIGWMRVTSASPCAWCAMLASRGFSYVSEASASFEAHSHCCCQAVPAWSQEAVDAAKDNPLYRQWQQATKGLSGADAMKAWRTHWDGQQNRDGVRVLPAA